MLGSTRLLTFAFRALVLLIALSILWISVAERYNEALVALARPLPSDQIDLRVLGAYILIQDSDMASAVSVNGFTLHYGLLLMAVLILAAVGIGVIQRVDWLLGMGAGVFLLHILGVTLLARGVSWAMGGSSAEGSEQLVFGLFALFWGLLPAIIGGAWCIVYWVPKVASKSSTPRST